jgi:hypothetical protein
MSQPHDDDNEVRMRIAVGLLLSVAGGCATYTLGAIVWTVADPQGAGRTLLFTIPVGFALATGPGLLGLIGLIYRCDWGRRQRRTRPRRAPRAAVNRSAPPAAAPPPPRERGHAFDYDDADFALAG